MARCALGKWSSCNLLLLLRDAATSHDCVARWRQLDSNDYPACQFPDIFVGPVTPVIIIAGHVLLLFEDRLFVIIVFEKKWRTESSVRSFSQIS